MDPKTIDATLASMKPEEIEDAIWMVGVFQRWGSMSAEEADQWQRKILARQDFLRLPSDAAPADR